MKVVFYLTKNKRINDGITRVIKEITDRFSVGENLYSGFAFLYSGEDFAKTAEYFKDNFPRLALEFKNTRFSESKLSKFCEFIMPPFWAKSYGTPADVHVFFNNFIPFNRVKGKRIVVIHDLSLIYNEKNFIKKFIYKKRFAHTVKVADIIVAVSSQTKDEIIKTFPKSKDKITVNYNGVDISKFEEKFSEDNKKKVKDKYGIKKEYLLFVGQPRINKNLPRAFAAFAALPERIKEKYSFVVANHNDELKKLAEELSVKDNVVLLNGIEENDLVCLLSGARAGILVSTKEGFGLPLVEGMAAGIPMLTSNVSCMPEIAGEAAVYADPYSVDSIKDGMVKVLTDDKIREEIVEKGKERVKSFTWERCAEEYERLFK